MRQQFGYTSRLLFGPRSGIVYSFGQIRDDFGMDFNKLAIGEKKFSIRHQSSPVNQRTSLRCYSSNGQKRIPDHPSVNIAAVKGRTRISRWQIDRANIGIFQTRVLQDSDEQVLDVRSFV